jgi:hypothetical protein
MAHQAADDSKDPAVRQEPRPRGTKPQPADPSGHNTQVKPAQQEQIARSEEHRGDAAKSGARSDVDQETVNDLKD